MRRKLFSIPFGFLLLVTIFIVQLKIHDQNKQWQQQHDEKLDFIMEHYQEVNYKDSCYHEHLKDCSYIDRESVKVGRNGVLYSNYHKTGGLYGG